MKTPAVRPLIRKVELGENIYLTTMLHGNITEHFLTVLKNPNESPSEVFKIVDHVLAKFDSASILRMDTIGRINTHGTADLSQMYCYNCNDCHLNETRELARGKCPIAGVYVHAVSGANIKPVWLGGKLVGNCYQDEFVRYVTLDNLQAEHRDDRNIQARQLFERINDALRGAGMSFGNVIRTWFYLDDILEWYDVFNQVRDDFFKKNKVFDGLVPAGTGVGGSNRANTAIEANVLAVEALSDKTTVRAVASPLQCPAIDYGSSFSRAVEVSTPQVTRLYISGTASIHQDGHTLHVDDIDAQIKRTMDVTQAILTSRGMDWRDVVRGVAYLKHDHDIDSYHSYCRHYCLPDMPVGAVKNDVCRDDLLFEIEVDAMMTKA